MDRKKRTLPSPICTIKNIDGVQYLFDPKGNKLPHQIFSRVTDEYQKPTTALIKLFVKLE